MGQLPGGRALLRSLAHNALALREPGRAQGGQDRPECADSSAEPQSLHGVRGRRNHTRVNGPPTKATRKYEAKGIELDALIEEVYTKEEGISVLFRIISRRSWDELQSWHRALPSSRVEHLMFGLYVLHIPPGGSLEAA